MSVLDQFPDAEVCAGNIISNRQVVGVMRDGQEYLTDEGKAALQLEARTVDVEATVVSVDTDPEAPAKAPRKPKAKPAAEAPVDSPAPEAAAAADPTSDLDSLLADRAS